MEDESDLAFEAWPRKNQLNFWRAALAVVSPLFLLAGFVLAAAWLSRKALGARLHLGIQDGSARLFESLGVRRIWTDSAEMLSGPLCSKILPKAPFLAPLFGVRALAFTGFFCDGSGRTEAARTLWAGVGGSCFVHEALLDKAEPFGPKPALWPRLKSAFSALGPRQSLDIASGLCYRHILGAQRYEISNALRALSAEEGHELWTAAWKGSGAKADDFAGFAHRMERLLSRIGKPLSDRVGLRGSNLRFDEAQLNWRASNSPFRPAADAFHDQFPSGLLVAAAKTGAWPQSSWLAAALEANDEAALCAASALGANLDEPLFPDGSKALDEALRRRLPVFSRMLAHLGADLSGKAPGARVSNADKLAKLLPKGDKLLKKRALFARVESQQLDEAIEDALPAPTAPRRDAGRL